MPSALHLARRLAFLRRSVRPYLLQFRQTRITLRIRL